eukprot:365890-Chlamydomonas_euryale.AAC.4
MTQPLTPQFRSPQRTRALFCWEARCAAPAGSIRVRSACVLQRRCTEACTAVPATVGAGAGRQAGTRSVFSVVRAGLAHAESGNQLPGAVDACSQSTKSCAIAHARVAQAAGLNTTSCQRHN